MHNVVTIVTAVRDCLEETSSFLASLLNYPPSVAHEVVIVDDGSENSTKEFLQDNCGRNGYRLLRNETSRGFAFSNNRGASVSSAEWLFFLNNDLKLTGGWFDPFCRVIDGKSRLGNPGCIGNIQVDPRTNCIDHAGVTFVSGTPLHFLQDEAKFPKRNYSEFLAVTAACTLIRRELFLEAGGFDETYRTGYEDIDLCLRLRMLGYRHYVANQSRILHKRGSSLNRHEHSKYNTRVFYGRWGRLMTRFEEWDRFHLGEARLPAGKRKERNLLKEQLVKLGESFLFADMGALVSIGRQHLARSAFESASRVGELLIGSFPGETTSWEFAGRVALATGDYAEARKFFQQGVEVEPEESSVCLTHLAEVALRTDRRTVAFKLLKKALGIQPDLPRAHYLLGLYHKEAGNMEDALQAFLDAVIFEPTSPGAWKQIGLLHHKSTRTREAVSAFRHYLQLKPADLSVVRILVGLLESIGRSMDALSIYRQAHAQRPFQESPDLLEIGRLLYDLGRFDESELWLKQCLDVDGFSWQAWHYLGNIYVGRKDFPESVKAYGKALSIQPDHPPTLNNLANCCAFLCDWSQRDGDIQQVQKFFAAGKLVPGAFEVCGLALNNKKLSALGEKKAATILKQTETIREKLHFHFKKRRPGRHRIGFISSDLRNHAVGHLFGGLLSHLDEEQFETYVYSTGPDDKSNVRKGIVRDAEHFRDLTLESLPAKARRIHADNLDLLVDLGGHSMGANPEVLALRPARRQAHYLGYATTLGRGLVDYHIADGYVIPKESLVHYAEKVVSMPGSFLPPGDFTGFAKRSARKAVGLPAKGFVFCAFHAAYKIDPQVFDAWMRILKAVPDSVLWLKFKPAEAAMKNLRAEAVRQGIPSRRLIMADDLESRAEHLSRMAAADLFLDCPSYNGHASSMDALHAKLPILSVEGNRFCNRVGGSLLVAFGMQDLICPDLECYVEKAIELGSKPSLLLPLRKRLVKEKENVLCPKNHADRFRSALLDVIKGRPAESSSSPSQTRRKEEKRKKFTFTLLMIRPEGITNWLFNVDQIAAALASYDVEVLVIEKRADKEFHKPASENLKRVKTTHNNPCSMVNLGISRSSSEVVCTLDDPMRVLPAGNFGEIFKLAADRLQDKKLGLLAVGSEACPQAGCLVAVTSVGQQKPIGILAPLLFAKRKVWERVGGLRSKAFTLPLAWLDLSLRAEKDGFSSALISSPVILPPAESSERLLASSGKKVRETFAKHWQLHPSPLLPHASELKQPQTRETPHYHEWVALCDTLTETDLARFRGEADKLTSKPLISVVMPVYNPPRKFLQKAIESVLEQAYENWELCIADDASTKKFVRPLLEKYARQDLRIKVTFRKTNGHISLASNSALKLAKGEYVAFLDHDDELRPHSLLEVAKAINDNPSAALIYSDEDKIDEKGHRFNPHFKPDWNPDLFLAQNYLCHLVAVRFDLIREARGFRKGFEGAQDWDLLLRVVEDLSDDESIIHLPEVLYHWRAIKGSTASGIEQKVDALESIRKTIRGHLNRRKTKARLSVVLNQFIRVQRELPSERPLVSILISTRDRVDLLSKCLESLRKTISYEKLEILILDNDSSEPETLAYFRKIRSELGVKVFKVSGAFNYSRINNLGAHHAKGELLLLLNNDIEAVREGWLEEMISHAMRQEIGCVGAKLLYPDGTIQHGGVVLGIRGVAGHAFRGFLGDTEGYMGYLHLARNYSAVTGACLMIRKKTYWEVGGLDEGNFGISFNDVDFCLRVSSTGYRNLWTPHALLYHHESASRGDDQDPFNIKRAQREQSNLSRRWSRFIVCDPGYNRNFSLRTEQFQLSVPEHTLVPDEPTASPESTHSFSHTAVGSAYRRLYDQLRVDHGEDQALELVVGGDFEEVGLQEIGILRYFGLKETDFLVDVGCGSGRLAIPLSNSHKGGYLGTDVVPEALEYARQQVSREDWRFELVEELMIPLPDQTADMICFFSVFTHLLHEQTFQYLSEALRVLRPGGRIVFSFLDFEERAHWPHFESSIHCFGRGNPLNVFVDRNAIRAWTEILGVECRAIWSASRNDRGDFPVPSFGQSLALLVKENKISHATKDSDQKPAEITGPSEGEYKKVWNELSATYESAKLHVTGEATEDELQASGKATVKRLMESFPILPNETVLEIGCGIGRIGRELAPKCRKWIGCDVSPNMLAFAKNRLADLNNVELIELPGSDLMPVPDASVDVIYCSVVFMHLAEWDRFEYVKEAFRVLRKGGRFYADNFNLLSEEGWNLFMQVHDRPRDDRPPHISKSSTPDEIQAYLQQAGFGSINVQTDATWVWGSGIKQ